MIRLRELLGRRAREERGGVLILVAIGLPAFVMFGAFVINIGNWWVHKRHLQVQADAAALAGAMRFVFPECNNDLIAQTAIQYSGGRELQPGDATRLDSPTWWNDPPAAWVAFTPIFNPQLGEGNNSSFNTNTNNRSIVRTGVNRPNVLGRQETADTPADLGDAASYSSTDASIKPCAKQFIDVKMTEARDMSSNPLHYLTAWWTPHYVDAQARVTLFRAKSLSDLLPIGVEEVNPKRAKAWFYDEDTGTELASTELVAGAPEGNLLVFDNSAAPVTFDPHVQRIGVTIALSGTEDSVSCGTLLVVCYGASDDGLTRIRGYETSGTGTRLEEVFLSGCATPDNGYFNTVCTGDRVSARITGLSLAEDADKIVVEARHGGDTVRLHYCSGTGLWESVTKSGNNPPNCSSYTTLPISLGTGTHEIDIHWEQQGGFFNGVQCKQNAPCNVGGVVNAHKTFSGNTESNSSGPIKLLQINSGTTTNLNNVTRCAVTEACPASFVVKVGVAGRLALANKTDDPIALRVFKADRTSPSLKHQLDCDPNLNGQDEEIARGCDPEYVINTDQPCGPTGADRNALWASPQPWPCVATDTGTNEHAASEGLNARVLCFPANSAGNCHDPNGNPNPNNPTGKLPYNPTSCTNWNRWPDWRDSNIQIPPDDPRRVGVFLVPFGTFDTAGQGTMPVIDFAQFYVTGWHGKGRDANPCDGFNAHPDEFWDDDAPGGSNKNNISEISGHFIQYVLPNTGETEGACDPTSLTPCVAVMTK
jgi:hypothetical protein